MNEKKTKRIWLFLTIPAVAFFATYPARAFDKEITVLSVELSEKISASGKKTIAVVDFTDIGGHVTELGRFLGEEVSVALSINGKGFEVIDRMHLKSLLAEHKLSDTGLIDPNAARELGKITGVEVLVTGTITPLGNRIRLSVKVLDITTARIIAAARCNIERTEEIDRLLSGEIPALSSLKKKSETLKEQKGNAFECEYFRAECKKIELMRKGYILATVHFYRLKESPSKNIILRLSRELEYEERIWRSEPFYPTPQDRASYEKEKRQINTFRTSLESLEGDFFPLSKYNGITARSQNDELKGPKLSSDYSSKVTFTFKTPSGLKNLHSQRYSLNTEIDVYATRSDILSGRYVPIAGVPHSDFLSAIPIVFSDLRL